MVSSAATNAEMSRSSWPPRILVMIRLKNMKPALANLKPGAGPAGR